MYISRRRKHSGISWRLYVARVGPFGLLASAPTLDGRGQDSKVRTNDTRAMPAGSVTLGKHDYLGFLRLRFVLGCKNAFILGWSTVCFPSQAIVNPAGLCLVHFPVLVAPQQMQLSLIGCARGGKTGNGYWPNLHPLQHTPSRFCI